MRKDNVCFTKIRRGSIKTWRSLLLRATGGLEGSKAPTVKIPCLVSPVYLRLDNHSKNKLNATVNCNALSTLFAKYTWSKCCFSSATFFYLTVLCIFFSVWGHYPNGESEGTGNVLHCIKRVVIKICVLMTGIFYRVCCGTVTHKRFAWSIVPYNMSALLLRYLLRSCSLVKTL